MSVELGFPVCALPGCRAYVEAVGEVCNECITDFGPHLQPTGAPAMTAERITRRNETVRAIYAERLEPQRETRRNQRCWICEGAAPAPACRPAGNAPPARRSPEHPTGGASVVPEPYRSPKPTEEIRCPS